MNDFRAKSSPTVIGISPATMLNRTSAERSEFVTTKIFDRIMKNGGQKTISNVVGSELIAAASGCGTSTIILISVKRCVVAKKRSAVGFCPSSVNAGDKL